MVYESNKVATEFIPMDGRELLMVVGHCSHKNRGGCVEKASSPRRAASVLLEEARACVD